MISEQIENVWKREERSTKSFCMKQQKRSNCNDLYNYYGINRNGYYFIQPEDEKEWDSIGTKVECSFDNVNSTSIRTIVHHDSEVILYVRSGIDGPNGNYFKNITYQSNLNSIVALINNSKSCRQYISWECSGTGNGNGIYVSNKHGTSHNKTCNSQDPLACNCDMEIK